MKGMGIEGGGRGGNRRDRCVWVLAGQSGRNEWQRVVGERRGGGKDVAVL